MPPRAQRQRSQRNNRYEATAAQVGTGTIASPNINPTHAHVGESTNAAAPADVPAGAAPAAAPGPHALAPPPQTVNDSIAPNAASIAAAQAPALPTPAAKTTIATVAAAAPVDNGVVAAVMGHITPVLHSLKRNSRLSTTTTTRGRMRR